MTRRFAVIRILLTVSLLGTSCTPDTTRTSAWLTVENGFSALMENDGRAAHYFATDAYSDTAQLRRERNRYSFLHIEEMRFTKTNSRQGSVALSIDEWPITMHFAMERSGTQWRITSVDAPRHHTQLRSLLGLQGLPIVEAAPNWAGGLNARDRHGRPNSGILLTLLGGQVFLDSHHEIPYHASHIRNALRDNIETRKQLSATAKATYRPHVAIASSERAPAKMTIDLVQWSFSAGAQTVQILVRRPGGRPGGFTLGRVDSEMRPNKASWDLAIRWNEEQLQVIERKEADPLFMGGLATLKENGAFLTTPPPGKTTSSALISLQKNQSHGDLAELLSLLYSHSPGMHVALEHTK